MDYERRGQIQGRTFLSLKRLQRRQEADDRRRTDPAWREVGWTW